MTKFKVKIIRDAEFEITIQAASREEAAAILMALAIKSDDQDRKKTKIVYIKEEI